MSFQAQVNQELGIDNVSWRIAEHPAAPGMSYGQEGRQAIVYQLVAGAERRAFKIFKPRYRFPGLVTLADRLAAFAGLPGLEVCQRTVLTPHRHAALLQQYPDLTYAVLMQWVEGPTWTEVLLEKRQLIPEQSLTLARSLIDILSRMEQRSIAHCDLSGSNVLLPALASQPLAPQSSIASRRRANRAIKSIGLTQMPRLEMSNLFRIPTISLSSGRIAACVMDASWLIAWTQTACSSRSC